MGEEFISKPSDESRLKHFADIEPGSIDAMASQELAHLKRAAEIEERIEAIQHSTRVDIAELAPLHNYLRAKYAWYYRWHMSRTAHKIQYFILAAYLFFWLWIFLKNR